jgi:glutathione S-transferase
MILYYAPGACSLADHIALCEADIKFDLVKVDLKTYTLEDGRPFTEINPKGYVPALQFEDGEVLTENIAILSFIADRYPALMAPGPLGRYRLLEMLAYISTEIHKSFKPFFSPDATDAEKKKAADTIATRLAFISTQLKGHYLFGQNATVADAYLFVMLMWAAKNRISVSDKLTAFSERMKSRPTVQVALKHEGLISHQAQAG